MHNFISLYGYVYTEMHSKYIFLLLLMSKILWLKVIPLFLCMHGNFHIRKLHRFLPIIHLCSACLSDFCFRIRWSNTLSWGHVSTFTSNFCNPLYFFLFLFTCHLQSTNACFFRLLSVSSHECTWNIPSLFVQCFSFLTSISLPDLFSVPVSCSCTYYFLSNTVNLIRL